MYPCLLALLLSLLFQTNGLTQIDSIPLEKSIELKFEAKYAEYPFPKKSLIVKVYLKNITENKIYILANSCYRLEQFFQIKNKHLITTPGLSCTFSYPIVETLLPGEPLEFRTYLFSRNGMPQEVIDIGLELIKVPEKKVQESSPSLCLYDEIDYEKFVFWKKIECYSFSIKIPFLRI